jgi:hypothetical protein
VHSDYARHSKKFRNEVIKTMIRQLGIVLLATIASWYGMMAIHEVGHCLAAWVTGGVVEKVHFPLLGFSQTFYHENPHPLAVAWAGAAGCAVLAALLLRASRNMRRPYQQALLYFAGFSLIANGLYLGLGGFDRVGDCAELLNHGAKLWQLVAVGIGASALGVYSWHRMGPLRGWFKTAKDAVSAE